MSNQLVFNNTNLSIINHNNQIWFTSVELAKALKYKRPDSVSRIYSRNQDEFTSCMTETVNLTLSGNLTKSVRIFSLRGAHLIAMFANTDVAKDFRKWVLNILDKEVGNAVPITPIQPEKYCRYEMEITITDNVFQKGVRFNTKAIDANAMVTGFARTLGFKN